MTLADGDPHRAAICLDGRNLALNQGTGVAQYARALAEGLAATGRAAAVLQDAAAVGQAQRLSRHANRPAGQAAAGQAAAGQAAARQAAAGRVSTERAWRWLRAAWPGARQAVALAEPPAGFAAAWLARDVFRQAQVHFDLFGSLLAVRSRRSPALMHWTYPLPLVFQGAPNVYTVHDLIPLRSPQLTPIDSRRFGRIIRAVVRRADHVITVSEAARHDIISLLGVPETRVTNTYQPYHLPAGLRRAAPPARQGHLLFIGSIEPRKNIAGLITAYRASGAKAPLILAGPDGWRAAQAIAGGGVQVRPLPATQGAALPPNSVWRAAWLPRPALLDLLRGARALLLPSLAEGFGLPIVEAMALDVPVMTSAEHATGEIAGAAALLVDPLDTRAMAAAISALDGDTALCERLVAAGRRRVAMFSPAACSERLAAVYDRLGVARA